MGIRERFTSGTPRFFRKLRTIGLALIAAGSAVTAATQTLPEIVVHIGGYMIVAGSVMTAVSQAVVKGEE